MLQYELDHMGIDRWNMEMRRTEVDARHSYNDFNTIMMVSDKMIANNISVPGRSRPLPRHDDLGAARGALLSPPA